MKKTTTAPSADNLRVSDPDAGHVGPLTVRALCLARRLDQLNDDLNELLHDAANACLTDVQDENAASRGLVAFSEATWGLYVTISQKEWPGGIKFTD